MDSGAVGLEVCGVRAVEGGGGEEGREGGAWIANVSVGDSCEYRLLDEMALLVVCDPLEVPLLMLHG